MILIGRYRSPFTRRVAIAMRLLGMTYEHKPQTALQQLEEVQKVNPVGRVPALVLDVGEVLFDSWAILDWLDHAVEPERRLVPDAEPQRHQVLRVVATAMGALEKTVSIVYEGMLRPEDKRHLPWVERCAGQVASSLAALDRLNPRPLFFAGRLTQADVTAAVAAAFVRQSVPNLMPEGRYHALDALLMHWEETEAFRQTQPEP